jgi:hypothetical protein
MSGPLAPTVIAGDLALANFRQGLTGPYALDLLRQAGGRLLVQLAVGAGKTEWLLKIILHALTEDTEHDLVVVLVPRRDILRELLGRLPASLPRQVLEPRPRKRCGSLDADWQQYERQGCGLLGREHLCGGCPLRARCPWPDQYGKGLQGARLVLATQQHLLLNPLFIRTLAEQVHAQRPLVLLDESDSLIRSAERTIRLEDLERFITAQESVLAAASEPTAAANEWLTLSRLVAVAPTADLRDGDWSSFPWVDAAWATAVQKRGVQLFHQDFHFLGYELRHFTYSDPGSRERLHSGDLRFAGLPSLGDRFLIFSGSIARDLARYRLDPNHARPALVSPFDRHRFEHPDTRWYNLNTLDGAARFFPSNAARILDFFARKVAQNIAAGKRTLLVSRKKFVRMCRTDLRRRLAALGAGPVKIVTGDWARHDLEDPRTVALINYGVAGLNRFQHCEAAYCLNSFYVSPAVVAQTVHDIEPSTDRYPVSIRFAGRPRRRQATVTLPDARETIVPRIAQGVLDQKEADVVVQAVGRVRPFTRPREVITFHAGTLPGVSYTLQFDSLAQARSFFNIPTTAAAEIASRAERARRLKAEGWSKARIATELGVSPCTVKRYLRR